MCRFDHPLPRPRPGARAHPMCARHVPCLDGLPRSRRTHRGAVNEQNEPSRASHGRQCTAHRLCWPPARRLGDTLGPRRFRSNRLARAKAVVRRSWLAGSRPLIGYTGRGSPPLLAVTRPRLPPPVPSPRAVLIACNCCVALQRIHRCYSSDLISFPPADHEEVTLTHAPALLPYQPTHRPFVFLTISGPVPFVLVRVPRRTILFLHSCFVFCFAIKLVAGGRSTAGCCVFHCWRAVPAAPCTAHFLFH